MTPLADVIAQLEAMLERQQSPQQVVSTRKVFNSPEEAIAFIDQTWERVLGSPQKRGKSC